MMTEQHIQNIKDDGDDDCHSRLDPADQDEDGQDRTTAPRAPNTALNSVVRNSFTFIYLICIPILINVIIGIKVMTPDRKRIRDLLK